jgi:hypothetical protein
MPTKIIFPPPLSFSLNQKNFFYEKTIKAYCSIRTNALVLGFVFIKPNLA